MDISQVAGSSYVASAVSNVQAVPRPQVAESQVAQAVTGKASPEQLQQAVGKINDVVQAINPGVEFSVESNFRTVVVSVVDKESSQVIRQIPTDDAINISRALEVLQGLLIKQKV
ncbi:MAG: flagellar protein FlaG [Methylophilaceae bacterium]